MRQTVRILAAAGFATVISAGLIGAAGSHSQETLALRIPGGWETWWRRNTARVIWNGEAPWAHRIRWRPAQAGLEWSELQLKGANEAWRTRVVLVRLEPRSIDLRLDPAFTRNEDWAIGDADGGAALALDAGQFRHSLPYGWVVSEGKELLAPEYAPLAGAVVVDSSGDLRIVAPDSVKTERVRGTAREAFQSYPMLLQDGEVPPELRESGKGVDLTHRDARLALGTLADGRVVIALTRFDALGESLGRVPLGLTTPEMAAVMGALGCRQALLLDGGISGQLLLRTAGGVVRSWRGTRSVPLGLIGRPKRTDQEGSHR